MKIQERYVLRPTPRHRVFLSLTGPYSEAVNEAIKQFPGVTWGPILGAGKCWMIPIELREQVRDAINEIVGYRPVIIGELPGSRPDAAPPDADLRPWQADFQRFARTWAGGGAFFEQGLGKTIAILRSRVGKTLIVVPPGTLASMQKQIAKWAPDAMLHVYATATKKAWPPPPEVEIVLTTYTLIDDDVILDPGNRFSTLIFDEAHKIKNYKSGRARAAKKLRAIFPFARVFLATGTPQGEGFHEWFQYADMIWPHRFGRPDKFLDRYVLRERIEGLEDDDPRRKIVGLNQERADEFRARIAALGIRVVKADVKDQLPPLEFQAEWIDSERRGRKAIEDLFTGAADEEAYRKHMRLVSPQKIAPTLEAIESAIDNGAEKIFVAGWFRGFVEAIGAGARELAKERGLEVIITTGGGEGRDDAMSRAERAEKAIVVATIASVAEGRNELAQYPFGILGEVHYSPIIMSQLFARLHRLDTLLPVTIKAILLRDSLDERIAEIMSGKVEAQNEVIKLGLFEQAWKDEVTDKAALINDSGWREALAAEINAFGGDDKWLAE